MNETYTGIFNYETIRNGHSLFPVRYAGLFNISESDSGIHFQGIVTLCLIPLNIAGCFGNALICYVIAKNKQMHTSINFYLLSQSISDSLFFLTFTFNAIYCMNLTRILPDTTLAVISIIFKLIHYIGNRATILTKIAIAFDRYIAICHPLMSSKLLTRRRTIKIIILIWSVSFLWCTNYVACEDIANVKCWWSELYYHAEFQLIHIFPIIFIGVIYSLIGLEIRKSSKFLNNSRNLSKCDTEIKGTRRGLDISVAAIVEYVICWFPISLIYMLYTYNLIDRSKVHRNIMYFLVALLMFFMSTVLNPMLYSMMCLQFREAFKNLLCCSGHINPNNGQVRNRNGNTLC